MQSIEQWNTAKINEGRAHILTPNREPETWGNESRRDGNRDAMSIHVSLPFSQQDGNPGQSDYVRVSVPSQQDGNPGQTDYV